MHRGRPPRVDGASPVAGVRSPRSRSRRQETGSARPRRRGRDGKEKPTREDRRVPENSFHRAGGVGRQEVRGDQPGAGRSRSSASWKRPTYVVSKIEQKDRQERPPAPFTTSTLQQQACAPPSLRRQADDDDRPAAVRRRGTGRRGLGRPHHLHAYRQHAPLRRCAVSRAASTSRRPTATRTCPRSRTPTPPARDARTPTKRSGRPTCRYTPERSAKFLPQDQLQLYTLIYNRFVACQMKPADLRGHQRRSHGRRRACFKARARSLKFDGYRKVWHAAGKQEDALLPPMKRARTLDLLDLTPTQHFTEPPPRLQRSVAGQDARKGRHRPAEHLRDDHQQDSGTRVRRAEGTPILRDRRWA